MQRVLVVPGASPGEVVQLIGEAFGAPSGVAGVTSCVGVPGGVVGGVSDGTEAVGGGPGGAGSSAVGGSSTSGGGS